MKRDLRNFFAEVGLRLKGEPHEVALDFEKMSKSLSNHHVDLSGRSLKRLWDVTTGKRKLSKEACNRLALFAGFQSWDDLLHTLRGDTDASINYEEQAE